ncbi:MAG: ketopantoate reductase family protein [Candidatus Scatomorpha sp.]
MRVVILGAGRMGSAIGACMKRAGDEVILIDIFAEHIQKINEKGLDWQKNEEKPINVTFDGAFTTPKGQAVCDVAIVLTSGIYTDEVVSGALGNVIGPDTYVVTFQNGLGHADVIAKYVDIDHILHGMLKLGGKIIEPGWVQTLAHPDCCVTIGSVRQDSKANEISKKIAASITTGGIISEHRDDINLAIWEKVLNNCAFNSIASLARTTMGNVIAGKHGRPILLSCIKEVVDVANAKGIPLNYEKCLEFIDTHSYKNYKDHFPSMTYDVRAKRNTEIDYLNGAISNYGRELGIPTPTNDLLTLLIHCMEDGYSYGF